jgi:hypothetical protein
LIYIGSKRFVDEIHRKYLPQEPQAELPQQSRLQQSIVEIIRPPRWIIVQKPGIQKKFMAKREKGRRPILRALNLKIK